MKEGRQKREEVSIGLEGGLLSITMDLSMEDRGLATARIEMNPKNSRRRGIV